MNILYKLASSLLVANEIEEINKISDAIQKVEKNSRVSLLLQAIYNGHLKNKNIAENIIEKALSISKQSLSNYENKLLAIAYKCVGNMIDAIKCLELSLKFVKYKEDPDSYKQLIMLLMEGGQFSKGIILAKDFLKEEQNHFDIKLLVSLTLYNLKLYEEATQELNEIIDKCNEKKIKSLAYYWRSRTRLNKDFDLKINDLKEAHKICPELKFDIEIAKTYFEGNRLIEAEEEVKKLETKYKIDENYSLSLIKGATLRYNHLNFEEALIYYKKAEEVAPDNVKEHILKQIKIIEIRINEVKNKDLRATNLKNK